MLRVLLGFEIGRIYGIEGFVVSRWASDGLCGVRLFLRFARRAGSSSLLAWEFCLL